MPALLLPDYNNCILNTTASLLKHYNAPVGYPGVGVLDAALRAGYKSVVLMIFDGLGAEALRGNLPENSFLRRHTARELLSVCPCTTTAATPSYYSGLSPNEHGWLGWSLYFKEYGRIVDAFSNRDSFTKDSVGERHAAFTLMPYGTIFEKIHKATGGGTKVYTLMPSVISFFESPNKNIRVDGIEEIVGNVGRLCGEGGSKFILSYWPEPDSTMHSFGCGAPEAKAQLDRIDSQLERMCRGLKDTLVIVSADHGLVDIDREIYLNDIPEIDDCLLMPPSVEPRALSLFVKPEKITVFEERFRNLFGNDFVLYTKAEVLEKDFFGRGVRHRKVADFTGDYLAFASGSSLLRYKTLNGAARDTYKGHHAGLTAGEMLVPLVIVGT